MISDSSQKPLHTAANSNQSENSAAPALRKPWKAPHMIVSSTEEETASAGAAHLDGSANS